MHDRSGLSAADQREQSDVCFSAEGDVVDDL